MFRWQATAALGAGFALIAVILGALGRHTLAGLDPAQASAYDTAQRYQFFHAIALLVVALWMRQEPRPNVALRTSAILFVVGMLCFSGSIYLLLMGAPRWLGPITPLGGLLLMAGWLSLIWAALRPKQI